MATIGSRNSPSSIIDSTPLLGGSVRSRDNDRSPSFVQWPGLRGAARFLRRGSSHRMMREPSMLVRETAAEQLEERQGDWAFSRPVVILDTIWNLALVAVAIVILILSRRESPSVPLRLWIVGYALQCILHVFCVCFEYRRRRHSPPSVSARQNADRGSVASCSSSSDSGDASELAAEQPLDEEETSIVKQLESANSVFSFMWWITGFYWVSAAGQTLTRDSPQLYWLCIIFLAFDVFFVIFCIALACVIGFAVCCCLPCIIALLYAAADQEGASKEDIEQLRKFKFRTIGDCEKLNGEIQVTFVGIMTECDTDIPTEHDLSQEDAECCICLSAYDDGAELRALPCCHHFHCTCIDKWLYINATCPLCKYNITKRGNQGSEEA